MDRFAASVPVSVSFVPVPVCSIFVCMSPVKAIARAGELLVKVCGVYGQICSFCLCPCLCSCHLCTCLCLLWKHTESKSMRITSVSLKSDKFRNFCLCPYSFCFSLCSLCICIPVSVFSESIQKTGEICSLYGQICDFCPCSVSVIQSFFSIISVSSRWPWL